MVEVPELKSEYVYFDNGFLRKLVCRSSKREQWQDFYFSKIQSDCIGTKIIHTPALTLEFLGIAYRDSKERSLGVGDFPLNRVKNLSGVELTSALEKINIELYESGLRFYRERLSRRDLAYRKEEQYKRLRSLPLARIVVNGILFGLSSDPDYDEKIAKYLALDDLQRSIPNNSTEPQYIYNQHLLLYNLAHYQLSDQYISWTRLLAFMWKVVEGRVSIRQRGISGLKENSDMVDHEYLQFAVFGYPSLRKNSSVTIVIPKNNVTKHWAFWNYYSDRREPKDKYSNYKT